MTGSWNFRRRMKISLRHMFWISVLLCSNTMGQTAAYTIKPGDSLARIARNHGCTAQELAAANGLKLNAVIHPGQNLKLPGQASANDAEITTPAPASGSHTIQAGETLSAVSRRYKMTLDSLLAANPGINPKTLKVGQKIQLAAVEEPKPAAAAAPAPTAPPALAVKESLPVSDKAAAEPAPAHVDAKIRSVMVDSEITYGEFAAKHGTDTVRLNDLNGLDLSKTTVLAKGSELYVQAGY